MFNFITGKIKFLISLTVFLFSFLNIYAQNNAIFNGGISDGFAIGSYIQAQAGLTGNAIFQGGIADGFAKNNYMQANAGLTGNAIYQGGIADGFAKNNYTQTNAGIIGNNIYQGGPADGFAKNDYTQTNAGITGNNIYQGGAADGFAFGSYGSFGNELPLPVELISFDAWPSNSKTVLCKWTTASELNSDYFTVERSSDGKNFEAVGKVKAAGNSSTSINYFLTDNKPFNGISYYKLKQTDFDGAFVYSEKVTVTFKNENTIATAVYPNPMNEFTNIVPGSSFGNKTTTFTVYDIQGKKIQEVRLTDLESIHENVFVFKRGDLTAGIYFYQLSNSDATVESGKLVVQ